MKLKRYRSIFLLTLFTLLTIISTRAGDIPVAPSPGFLTSVWSGIEDATSFRVSPLGVFRKTCSFLIRNYQIPVTACATAGSIWFAYKLYNWYIYGQNNATNIKNWVNEDAINFSKAKNKQRVYAALKTINDQELRNAIDNFYNYGGLENDLNEIRRICNTRAIQVKR